DRSLFIESASCGASVPVQYEIVGNQFEAGFAAADPTVLVSGTFGISTCEVVGNYFGATGSSHAAFAIDTAPINQWVITGNTFGNINTVGLHIIPNVSDSLIATNVFFFQTAASVAIQLDGTVTNTVVQNNVVAGAAANQKVWDVDG